MGNGLTGGESSFVMQLSPLGQQACRCLYKMKQSFSVSKVRAFTMFWMRPMAPRPWAAAARRSFILLLFVLNEKEPPCLAGHMLHIKILVLVVPRLPSELSKQFFDSSVMDAFLLVKL